MMNNVALWQLGDELAKVYEAVMSDADSETGEVDVAALLALDAADEAFQEKAAKTGKLVRFLLSEADKLKQEEDRAKAIRQKYERRAESIKAYLDSCLKGAGIRKIDRFPADCVISYRKSVKVLFDDESIIPDSFCRIKREPDKTAIGNAIKAGETVPGAHAEELDNIQLK